MIKLENVSKVYGKGDLEVSALKDVNLKIEEGELIAITGTSGSGKSTLLNILGCLDKVTSGKYTLNNRNINNLSQKELSLVRNQSIGFVVQYFALIDSYTVGENIRIPLDYARPRISMSKKNKMVESALDELGILKLKNKYPDQISGGEAQRVAIARAMINNPEVILADEPTGNLDTKNTDHIVKLFQELNAMGRTVIIVTHDMKVADKCERVLEIEDGVIL
ncbi:MAG: ABC transporter ATP-binding protein [Clostridiales bacterium]|nr:ABC transporter ATP-binding protein [Clostridiales bacterium]